MADFGGSGFWNPWAPKLQPDGSYKTPDDIEIKGPNGESRKIPNPGGQGDPDFRDPPIMDWPLPPGGWTPPQGPDFPMPQPGPGPILGGPTPDVPPIAKPGMPMPPRRGPGMPTPPSQAIDPTTGKPITEQDYQNTLKRYDELMRQTPVSQDPMKPNPTDPGAAEKKVLEQRIAAWQALPGNEPISYLMDRQPIYGVPPDLGNQPIYDKIGGQIDPMRKHSLIDMIGGGGGPITWQSIAGHPLSDEEYAWVKSQIPDYLWSSQPLPRDYVFPKYDPNKAIIG